MTRPQDLAMYARQNVSYAYRRAADACLHAANEWATVEAGLPDAPRLHATAQRHLEAAAQAIQAHDAAAAGAARAVTS